MLRTDAIVRIEQTLSESDPILGCLIASQSDRWPSRPTEDPIGGLIRIVMAQQISTQVACRLAERAKAAYPSLISPSPAAAQPGDKQPELKSVAPSRYE